MVPFEQAIRGDIDRIRGLAGVTRRHSMESLEREAEDAPTDTFLTLLEICVARLWRHRARLSDVELLQSILADDLSAFRFRNVGSTEAPEFHLQLIDNEHLHREIVDRTFELTRNAAFESAQRDYREAWKHYSKGDLDDAVVNAHKALESAAKIVIKRVDPASTPDHLQTNQIVPELLRLDVLPTRLNNIVGNLQQIFLSAGSLRNTAGTGHGSPDLKGPEATVTLLALRMSGTLVSFLAERWEQMKSKSDALE
jgi:hypothetical protein